MTGDLIVVIIAKSWGHISCLCLYIGVLCIEEDGEEFDNWNKNLEFSLLMLLSYPPDRFLVRGVFI